MKAGEWNMDSLALRETLDRLAANGTPVMAVVASAGTTATGSFDDLSTIEPLCESRDIWLHVDGAHGASAILSEAHRHRLRGIEHARSVTWDTHTMMLMPLAAGMLLVREENDLTQADFETFHVPETNILCFRWVGDRTLDDDALDAINLDLRTRYIRDGPGWVTTTVLGGRRVLRVTVMNACTTDAPLESLLDEMAQLASVRS